MKCKHIQYQLLDYSEDLLDRSTQELIKEHLQECAACRQELDDLEKTVHLLHVLPSQEPSEDFWNDFTTNVMRKIKRMEAPSVRPSFPFFPQFRMAAVAFAVLLIILGGVFLWYSISLQEALPPAERIAHDSAQQPQEIPLALQTPERELPMFEGIASEELLYDILDKEFAFTEGEVASMYRVDYSDEMLYFLISTLTEEEKDQLLAELYKMK